jgi:ABC-type dipeptide/oligopeptide/nickel transport system permease subunit
VHGTRISLSVGLGVMVLALLIGVPLGLLAGLSGGPVDYAIMRLVEVFTAVPALMLALLLIYLSSAAAWPNVILALGGVAWLDSCRLLRAQLLSATATRFCAGRTHGRCLWRTHRTPSPSAQQHCPLIVAVTIGIPVADFAEAGLSSWAWASTTPSLAGERWSAMPFPICVSTGTSGSFLPSPSP